MIAENMVPPHLLLAAERIFAAPPFSAVMVDTAEITRQTPDHRQRPQWLDAEEQRRWSAFRLAKRQNEWLAGRYCAKVALAGLLNRQNTESLTTLRIDNHDDGRPYVTAGIDQEKRVHISISHSGRFAAAIASRNRCGIDVQHRTEKLLRVRQRFCLEHEVPLMLRNRHDGDSEIDLLNILWTAKEAIRKAYSFRHVPGFLALSLDQAERYRQSYVFTCRHEQLLFTTLACRYGDYGLALCFLPSEYS